VVDIEIKISHEMSHFRYQ